MVKNIDIKTNINTNIIYSCAFFKEILMSKNSDLKI